MNSPPPDPRTALDALPGDREAWLRAARAAQSRAHSPYSGVRVGAALLDDAGRTFAGCNVENASYGLTICAERHAVGRAIADGHGPLVGLVITTDRTQPLMPCGACRQVLVEFAPDLVLWCLGAGGESVVCGLRELLPRAFGAGDLRP
jgi:cytidine deaminase